jgi:hypothetical protein
LNKIKNSNLHANVKDYAKRIAEYLGRNETQQMYSKIYNDYERAYCLEHERNNTDTELEIFGNVFTQERTKLYTMELKRGALMVRLYI